MRSHPHAPLWRCVASLGVSAVVAAAVLANGGVARAATRATSGASLSGAGSTFDQPFFARAFYQYSGQNPGTTITYSAIGSSGGIQQLQNQTVNFGATDVPMSASDLAAASGGPVLQIPVALGGEAIAYHVAGIGSGLRLSGSVLAGIFLGNVTYWDSRLITALNPHLHLPHLPITVVHRSDGSGTTYIFTNYLATVSAPWLAQLGVGKTINWPVGVGGQGNQGVATLVQEIPGAIGYVELDYALEAHFAFAKMRNASGYFVAPSIRSVAADAAMKPHVTAQNFSIVNERGANSYPIAGYSWIVAYARQPNLGTGGALATMLNWLTHTGQRNAAALDYVPLPANIERLAAVTIAKMTGPSGQRLLGA